jgi:hypothetical protein
VLNALNGNTVGSNNTALGNQALYNNATGNGNTALGISALFCQHSLKQHSSWFLCIKK